MATLDVQDELGAAEAGETLLSFAITIAEGGDVPKAEYRAVHKRLFESPTARRVGQKGLRKYATFFGATGHGHRAVPVPRAGTRYSYGYPAGGFIFTSDLLIENSEGRLVPNPEIRTAAQQNEASEMTVAMTDKLCLAATGEHCPP